MDLDVRHPRNITMIYDAHDARDAHDAPDTHDAHASFSIPYDLLGLQDASPDALDATDARDANDVPPDAPDIQDGPPASHSHDPHDVHDPPDAFDTRGHESDTPNLTVRNHCGSIIGMMLLSMTYDIHDYVEISP